MASPRPALLAIALIAVTVQAVPAFAQAGAQAGAQARVQAGEASTPATAAVRTPAGASERASAERMDPLSRSVFWAREFEISPADAYAGVRLTVALRELGQYDQAATTAEQVLVVRPDDLDALIELGRAHIARGQAFYGIAPLERAKAAAPRDWRPLSLLGVAYQQVRRGDDARAAWNEGLSLSPDNPEILTNAAVALTAEGNAPGAEALLRRAVAQPGATQKMRANLALVLGLQGKTVEAEQIIRRDLPPESADHNLAWLHQQTAAAMTPATTASVNVPAVPTADTGRTWGSLQGG